MHQLFVECELGVAVRHVQKVPRGAVPGVSVQVDGAVMLGGRAVECACGRAGAVALAMTANESLTYVNAIALVLASIASYCPER